jgi:hypothetical protein
LGAKGGSEPDARSSIGQDAAISRWLHICFAVAPSCFGDEAPLQENLRVPAMLHYVRGDALRYAEHYPVAVSIMGWSINSVI